MRNAPDRCAMNDVPPKYDIPDPRCAKEVWSNFQDHLMRREQVASRSMSMGSRSREELYLVSLWKLKVINAALGEAPRQSQQRRKLPIEYLHAHTSWFNMWTSFQIHRGSVEGNTP